MLTILIFILLFYPPPYMSIAPEALGDLLGKYHVDDIDRENVMAQFEKHGPVSEAFLGACESVLGVGLDFRKFREELSGLLESPGQPEPRILPEAGRVASGKSMGGVIAFERLGDYGSHTNSLI